MSKNTVKSHRGEDVDFDLFKIKEQIASSPKPDEVVKRERFIDKKKRRTVNRKVGEMLKDQAENQNYAKEMIESQRKSRFQQTNSAESVESAVENTEQVVESTDEPQIEDKTAPRINRRINR